MVPVTDNWQQGGGGGSGGQLRPVTDNWQQNTPQAGPGQAVIPVTDHNQQPNNPQAVLELVGQWDGIGPPNGCRYVGLEFKVSSSSSIP